METCGVNAAAMPASRCMSASSRAASRGRGIDVRRGRERRAQCHAGAHSGRLRLRVGIDDARIAVFGSTHHERRGLRAAARNASSDKLRHMRGDPQLARLEFERRLVGRPGPVGGGDAGRTRKTDGVALDPGSRPVPEISVDRSADACDAAHAAAAAH